MRQKHDILLSPRDARIYTIVVNGKYDTHKTSLRSSHCHDITDPRLGYGFAC